MENEGHAAGTSDFGTLLRSYRLTAGLSQEALAERAGISAHGIRALERGYRRTPQRGTLALLAGALSLSAEQCQEFETAAARWVLLRDGAQASVLAGPWPDPSGSNLPLSLASFVGRERELEEIAALLGEHRLVTLTGSGGVGKTQMALRVAGVQNDNKAVWFIPLAPVGDPSFVAAAIASTLGVQEVPNRPLLGTLIAYLKNKAPLLILDNCEHVIAEAATVTHALLAGCPHLRILATSRAPLRSAGERTYRLPPLSFPSREIAARLRATDTTTYGAIELFHDRARAIDHRFTLSEENAPSVAEICRRLDGIPLAIELAAARVNLLSITALAEKLEDRFRVLAGGERTAVPRQQTMRATIDWSYDLLSAPEQRVFERLSVFAGGCTMVSAEAVCAGEDVATADMLNYISSLVDKSMVVADFDGIEPRYRLLESFRQYGREKVAVRGEHRVVVERYALACLELAKWLVRARDTERDEVWRVAAYEELDNWRAVLQWTLAERADVALGQQLAALLTEPVWINFAGLEGRRWLILARNLVDGQTPISTLAVLSYAEAVIAKYLGEDSVQLSRSESAIAYYRIAGDLLGITRAQAYAGLALTFLGRVGEAKTVLSEALVGARGLNRQRLVAYLLRLLSIASADSGDLPAARSYLTEALNIYRESGAEVGAAVTEADLSEYEIRTGNANVALQRATAALATFRRFGNAPLIGDTLHRITMYLVSLDRYDEAEKLACEALDVARELQRDWLVASVLQNLVAIRTLRQRAVLAHQPKIHEQAARVLGFVDYRLAAIECSRDWNLALEYDRVLDVLRKALGAELVADLMSDGAAMTEDQAVAEASEI